jgi:hypothetical protein
MRTSPWRHLAALLLLGIAYIFFNFLLIAARMHAGGWSSAPAFALHALPGDLYTLLPAIAALAVGTIRFDRCLTSTAARMVVVVTVTMLALDLWIVPAAQRGTPLVDATFGDANAVRTIIAFATGHLPGTDELLRTYPAAHPRVRAEGALRLIALLALPTILVGLVLGVGAWVRDRVTFREPRDETIARWLLAWLLVPAIFALVVGWSGGYGARILFRGEPLWLVLVPYLPAAAVDAVGWRAARRAARSDVAPR